MRTSFDPDLESVTRFIAEEEFIYNIDPIFHQVFGEEIYSQNNNRYVPLRDYYCPPKAVADGHMFVLPILKKSA